MLLLLLKALINISAPSFPTRLTKGGYEMSLPDSSNIQEPEDAQDALLKKGAFVE